MRVARITVPSDDPYRRELGVVYTLVIDEPDERDSCTCVSWQKIRARSGLWEEVKCKHLAALYRELGTVTLT